MTFRCRTRTHLSRRRVIRGLVSNSPNLGPTNIREIVSLPATAEAGQVLSLAASDHNAIGHGGRFTVVENAGACGLVPTQCEDSNGRLLKYESPLDRRLSFVPQEDDTCGTVLKKLSDELSQRSPNVTVLPGEFPHGINPHVPYVPSEGSASGAIGRDILNDIVRIMNPDLATRGWRLTWTMWYSPAPAGSKPMAGLAFQVVAVHDTPPFMLHVDAVRPMATAVEIVQSRFSVTITYEDPLYKSAATLWEPLEVAMPDWLAES